MGRQNSWDPLTDRQREIWELLATKGLNDKEIGRILGLSPFTVHSHMKEILGKLGVTSRTQAIIVWWREQAAQKPE